MTTFDFEKEYTVEELLKIFELPLIVRRNGWTSDFYYRIDKIINNKTRGVSFIGNKIESEHRTYGLSVCFYVCKDRNPKFLRSYTDDDLKSIEEKYNLISEETIIKVLKNGEWVDATYLCLELRDNKVLIWVDCDGEEKFYKFSGEFVAFSDNEAKEKTFVFIPKGGRTEKAIDINDCNKFPRNIPPQSDETVELGVERKYHQKVDGYLLELRAMQYKKLDEANELRIEAQKETREGNAEALEIGQYQFNSHYFKADKLNEKADIIANQAGEQINLVQGIRREPYFARIDWGPSENRIHTTYFGEKDIENYVVSWSNASIGNLFYHTEELLNSCDIKIPLKRHFTFDNFELKNYRDEINDYVEGFIKQIDAETLSRNTDAMFTRLLEESRNEQEVHDIIRTIRSNQYDIISSDFDTNIVVNGCAGSGKTMILYHRLSFMAYNDAERFAPERCFVVTPTARYSSINSKLFEKLQLNDINNKTPDDFVRYIISEYCAENGVFDSTVFALNDGLDNSEQNNKYYQNNKFREFLSIIDEIKKDLRDFYIWYVKRINHYLNSCGFSTVSEIEMLLGKNNSLIADYSSNSDIENAYRNGAFRSSDWKSVYGSYKKTSSPEVFEKLCKYEFPLRTVLYGNQMGDGFKTIFNSSVKNFEGFLLLQMLERQISVLRDFYKDPGNDGGIYMSLCEFAMLQFKKRNPDLNEARVYRFEMLYYLGALTEKFGYLFDESRSIVFIDEFQNFSKFELALIKGVFSDCLYNFYGDYSQKMLKCGLSEDDITDLFDPYHYEIKENYRNAKEITEFINNNLGTEMFPIGLHGSVKIENFDECEIQLNGRTALIFDGDSDEIIKKLKDSKVSVNKTFSNNKIVSDKLNVLSVLDARGLEFETVYVYMPTKTDENGKELYDELNANKKYVAYTRALNSLTILLNTPKS